MQDVRHTPPTQVPQVPQVEATDEILGGEGSSRQPSQTSFSNAASESGMDRKSDFELPRLIKKLLMIIGDLHPSSAKIICPEVDSPPCLLAPLQVGDLLSFLEHCRGAYPSLALRLPADENGSPSIEISREMCQDLLLHVVESTRQRSEYEQSQDFLG